MRTVSLELSKALKEARYPQECFYYWRHINYRGGTKVDEYISDMVGDIASPTADEILDQLPRSVKGFCWRVGPTLAKENSFTIQYGIRTVDGRDYKHGNSLADAAAKCWLYLKKEGLL